MPARPDILVVGAGFAGATIARTCADAGRSVVVIDRRTHVAGNAFDESDQHGVQIHRYGPHIFHTNSTEVVEFLTRFTQWHPYVHRVLASHRGELFPIPVNRTTLERFFKIQLPDDQAAMALLDRIRESRAPIRTSEDTVLNSVGRELYQAFFAGYTLKQWGRDASQLDSSVIARIPVRTDRDDRYFSDRHQAMPRDGYTAMFMRMLNHPGIRVELGTDYTPSRHRLLARHLVYTGPLDAFFNYRLGALPYRSIRFELEHHAGALIQPVGTINNPDPSTPYTRVSEFRHLTGQQCSGTTLAREFPQAEGEPYYPIPTPETRELARQYTALADHENDVTFVGRLAQYRYYNMDQVVAAALTRAERVLAATV